MHRNKTSNIERNAKKIWHFVAATLFCEISGTIYIYVYIYHSSTSYLVISMAVIFTIAAIVIVER